MSQTQAKIIDTAYDKIQTLNAKTVEPAVKEAVTVVISQLNAGRLRAAEKVQGVWQTHALVKKAILLYFRIQENTVIANPHCHYYDKIPLKYTSADPRHYQEQGVRIVPTATIRYGAHVARNTVLMPSYVNIGAYIDEGALIDTWATVGSCAQIGKNVHLSGGAGIGGVLEPIQANPTIIEDNCFIGARSEIVEGVVVEAHAVISMGVFIGQSTPIYDRRTDQVSYGRVPSGAVVVPGNLPAANGKYSLYCAVIVKQVDAKTRAKISINDLLREVCL
jgi:2,3,4,5-tetrahydropyridine-2-carboxylate N-succinyltransferase